MSDIHDIRWNLLKNNRLKKTRGVSFENILQGKLIAIKKHPKKANQNIMLFRYKRYIWVVPYIVEENGDKFLKTLFSIPKIYKNAQGG